MPEELAVVLIVTAVVVGVVLFLFWVLPWMIEHAPQLPELEHDDERLSHHCHHAPTVPYTVAQAQRIMQRLIDCDATTCSAKAAAFRVLAEAGMVKPAKDLR
ncbi:hypothetical protein [Nocardia amamiensis]|uniref:hypothetical protein n=1 Tax=Nocardia amamiensis TaxID=404578 RepID=UPI00082F625B|nr:hypothetical protein [Nocardia amamiensis]